MKDGVVTDEQAYIARHMPRGLVKIRMRASFG